MSTAEQGYQPVQLWSWRGRVGRARFIAYSVWGYLLCIPAAFVLGLLAATTGYPELAALVALFTVVPYAVFVGFVCVQRSHDMDWNGWTTLLLLIPFLPLVWMIKSGSAGSNRYGLPPPPNTLSVKIGAWLMPLLAAGGIALAIASVSLLREVDGGAKAAQSKNLQPWPPASAAMR